MILGTAAWPEGPGERRALVARLESGRLADLNRIETLRLRKLGEGEPERLAEVLVPASLRRLLEGGPRALARVRQVLAYAEKWDRRGTLPAALAPDPASVRLLPCLPRPSRLRRADGVCLDRLQVTGPGAALDAMPRPTLAALGGFGGAPAGFCLALEGGTGATLGAWMVAGWPDGALDLKAGTHRRRIPLAAWEGLALPPLHAGEALLLPPPRLRPLPELEPDTEVVLAAPFDTLVLSLGPAARLGTVQ
ncbi:MAG TPA: hypothetical protein VF768_11870 [Holophagaceae bacterium]